MVSALLFRLIYGTTPRWLLGGRAHSPHSDTIQATRLYLCHHAGIYYFAEYFDKWRHWSKQKVPCTRRMWSYLQSTMTSSSQWPVCCEGAGWPTGWLVNSGLFTAYSHELPQKALRHYNRNDMNIVVCAITNNFEIVPYNNRTKLLKMSRVIKRVVAEILFVYIAIAVDRIVSSHALHHAAWLSLCTLRLNQHLVSTLITKLLAGWWLTSVGKA